VKIAVTGSHGLVGGRLIPALVAAGHEVTQVVRRADPGPGEASWDPAGGTIDRAALAGTDAVVHLAGVGIGDRRWNEDHKRAVLDSRVRGTDLIARTVAELDPPPRVLLSASAIGYYGDRDDELLTESSPSGTGFLAEVCRQWEAAARPAAEAGVRTVLLRTGIVQAREGGALARQVPIFRAGLGARFGPGRQWVSWIGLDDEVGAILALLDDDVSGPVNLVGPEPVTNAEYTATLNRLLHRPGAPPAPRFAVKLLLGAEMASEMLLASQRVDAGVLSAKGFTWRQPTLESVLRAELARTKP
jgi:uncharacterized protein (TIGR01777 family)